MSFDELLDFLFHRALGICITVASSVVLMLTLSSCLPLDFCACYWMGCGFEDCSQTCIDCSEDCDEVCYTCFGGSYDGSGDYASDSCALNECLFGKYGCEAECGDCYTVCGGLNYSLCDSICFEDGCGAECDDSSGYERATCVNCISYCEGTDDPDSPNYQQVYLYTITVKDINGNSTSLDLYESTRSIYADGVSGMIFVGYFSSSGGSGTQYTNGSDIILLPPEGATIYPYYKDEFDGQIFDFVVYERYENLNAEGTTEYLTSRLESLDFNINSGDYLFDKIPEAPGKSGYMFTGWTAVVNGNSYTLSHSDGSNNTSDYGVFRPGMFGFYYADGSSRTVQLYANYSYTRYSVTVKYPSSLSRSDDVFTVKDGEEISTLTIPENVNGYLYAGLATTQGSEIALSSDYKIRENLVLYAIYKDPIGLNFYEEQTNSSYINYYYEGQRVTLPEPQYIPAGMAFKCWYFSDDYSRELTEITMRRDFEGKTLVPHFTAAKYTVELYYDPANENPSETLEYYTGDVLPLPTPDRTFYTFGGWYFSPDLSGSTITTVEGRTENLKLYAKFNPQAFTVTLDTGAGSLPSGSSINQTVYYGQSYTLPIPSRTGYDFKGWYYYSNYTEKLVTNDFGQSLSNFGKLDGYTYSSNDDLNVTLMAKWERKTYDVSFMVDGVVVSTQKIEHNGYATAPQDPEKQGHTFKGWTLSGSFYDFGTQVTGPITLTASFDAMKYQISLIVLDGTFGGDGSTHIVTVEYSYGQGTVSFNKPVKTGYAFTGWYISPNGLTDPKLIDANGNVLPALINYINGLGSDVNEIELYGRYELE